MTKLKFWWNINFAPKNFEVQVTNLINAYIAHEVCSALDLGNGTFNILELFPKKSNYIAQIERDYKAYRQSLSLNSAHLIKDNMSGLEEYDTEQCEWLDWSDEGETLKDIISWNETADVIILLSTLDAQKNDATI
jgi:hypothetical protein